MPLTKEQLLQKRFKFILPFPGAHWRIGGIFELVGDDLYAVSGLPIKMLGCILEEYPHIFQPLPWHSDRTPEDMPEYVRYSEYYLNHYHLDGEYKRMIFKVDKWSNGHYGIKANGGGIIHGYEINFEPADESEYNAYINQKQQ